MHFIVVKSLPNMHKISVRRYCDILPTSIVSIVRKKKSENKHNPKGKRIEDFKQAENDTSSEYRVNEVNIQMISKNIYEQLFKDPSPKVDPEIVKSCREHLKKHGIDINKCPRLDDVILKIPKLEGNDVIEHFYNIGEQQSGPYRELLKGLVASDLPPMPKHWSKRAGWTRYDPSGATSPVPCPADDALVLDVEVLMAAGQRPTLAAAVSPHAWYGWVNEPLARGDTHRHYPEVGYNDLIPLETDGESPCGDLQRPRIVVGHNVSYDRSKIKEQYWREKTGVRFNDTMSMHTCVSGVTSYQRAVLKSKKPEDPDDDEWREVSSLNSLSEVHRLYCGSPIDKQTRNIFVDGTMADVHENFETLMTYCASDVVATWNVLRKLLPLFLERFPHPVTLAGMLELGSAYLPIDHNWPRYIESAETVYRDLNLETRQLLSLKADEACRMMINEEYRQDLWMWDQDWSTQQLKLKKRTVKKRKDTGSLEEKKEKKVVTAVNSPQTSKPTFIEYTTLCEGYIEQERESVPRCDDRSTDLLQDKFAYLYEMGELLPARRPFLPGYPAWYRKLCTKPGNDPDWEPGANNISTSMQITPKLLRLSWEGYPLHHLPDEKWGFLVPFTRTRPETYDPGEEPEIPLDRLAEACPILPGGESRDYVPDVGTINDAVERDMGRRTYYARKKLEEKASTHQYTGLGVWRGLQLQSCCHFLRLPHKDGPKNKVGNPLSKDFLDMFSQNVLTGQGDEAEKVLRHGRMVSYWRNNRARIAGQQCVWLPRGGGAILPRVVVCGTLTRRASEPTWMTASNAHAERVGSELRAAVRAPPGHRFVGADVDSQELWIAALLGDSTTGIAGGTAFGWSVLAGSKHNQSDLHSLTAKAAGISRDHAKVINYARIYGAGQTFAERLLKQFNPSMGSAECREKARRMFATTKGQRVYHIKPEYSQGLTDGDDEEVCMSAWGAARLARLSGRPLAELGRARWTGGAESAMFNALEDAADGGAAATAFLGGRLSRALAPGRWDATRHNWAVQSAAADFLHLMLCHMRHAAPYARFCLSFHDEVRYLAPREGARDAARALQLTNLLTRAFCSQRVGLRDLPLSVAFFTSVEVDVALRKDAAAACATPSLPRGLPPGEALGPAALAAPPPRGPRPMYTDAAAAPLKSLSCDTHEFSDGK